MILTFIQTNDEILKSVKQKSSLIAERQPDLFDQLVFDEEYLILFRRLFLDARANVISACSAYLKGQSDESYFDTQDFSNDKDFIIGLDINNFVIAVKDSVDVKMKEYLSDFILYQWLKDKSQLSEVYRMSAETNLQDMKRFLEMRTTRRKIKSNSAW